MNTISYYNRWENYGRWQSTVCFILVYKNIKRRKVLVLIAKIQKIINVKINSMK